VLHTSVRSVELERGLSSGLGLTLKGWTFEVKCSCMGDNLAGDVADRFNVLSRGIGPTILICAGDRGGNKEYLLAVGDGATSALPRAKGGLGMVGDVIRLANSTSPSGFFRASTVVDSSDVLAFLLDVAGDAQLSAALLRRASSEDDCDALGRLLMITVYRSIGL
jgi:hypothetical protein